MRKFINLSKERQIKLREEFPDLFKICCVEKSPHYTPVAISVFEDWLGKDAFQRDQPVKEEMSRRELLLYSFSKIMSEETETLNFKFRGRWTKSYPVFRKFASTDALHNYLNPADTSGDLYRLLLPELRAVFFESWDYTNVFYLQDAEVIPLIEKWASKAGVHVLSGNNLDNIHS